jgi:IS30 family transposase
MIQHLTESEKKSIDAFHKRGLDTPVIAAELVIGRHLREFVHLQDEVEAYIKEFPKRK